jgi:hypothetical protein
MFGIQTYFISKAISYLIRILFFSIDNALLDKDIFLIFLVGLNIIDWVSLFISISFQIFIFSKGMVFNKKDYKIFSNHSLYRYDIVLSCCFIIKCKTYCSSFHSNTEF